ncbi:hypothetical protein B0T16DRAFT_111912 [Cercophora newfieldiana]|uniref:F-box domain-containing protein n=1 Tax=Cercophora newfieldiana TaxID=92897 RepID=A0AA39Y9U6_9PEZI|nr:hypothetical protein B0T16DRAFT_111912 [Cercophora newfieldiana]
MPDLRKAYFKIGDIFRREKKQKWPNPRDSIGDVSDKIKDKRGIVQLTCWDAIGPAAVLWETLGDEIRNYMDDYAARPKVQLSIDLICEFKMFGPTEDTATPTVLFRSSDKSTRRLALKAMRKSNIMVNYPHVELVAFPPPSPGTIELLADSDAKEDPLRRFYSDNTHLVCALPSKLPVGRKLLVMSVDHGDLPQNATGGPLLCVGGRYFQLTAGHVFRQIVSSPPARRDEPPGIEYLDLDWSSEPEGEEESPSHSAEQPTVRLHGRQSPPEQPIPTLLGPKTASHASTPASKPGSHRSFRIGRPFQLPEAGGLDYALVELDPPHQGDFDKGLNRIPYRHNVEDHWLSITGFGHIRKKTSHWIKAMSSLHVPIPYISVAVMTSSSGLLMGKLCSTPSYIRLSGDMKLHEVFSIRLKGGTIAKGDSGSPVVDRVHGSFLGHIVAGAVGTGLAYVVSAVSIIEDIQTKLEHPVEFSPKEDTSKNPAPTEPRWRSSKHRKDRKYHFRIRYDLGTPSQYTEFGSKLSLDRIQALNATEGGLMVKKINQAHHAQGRTSTNPLTANKSLQSVFELHFFRLPLELQQEIFGYLEVPDILNFRLVSKSWNNFVADKELEIAFSYLRQPHIPALAIQLFPPTSPSTDLRYICSLWQRYSTACALATLISEWITTDMFLQKTPEERAQFNDSQSLIRRRIVPLLLVVMHFFETYRALRLDPLTADVDHAVLEKQIMSDYDNETLLQAHQFFRVLMTFQATKLRPPSYLSRVERSLRGYHRSRPPPENAQIAMLYIGGLRQLLRVTRIRSYEKLRRAVDEWYEDASRGGIMTQGEGSLKDPRDLTGEHKDKGKAVLLPTSLEAGHPVDQLSGESTQELLHKLPVSKSQIWVSTAESLLIERGVIERVQDLKGNAGVLQELIVREVSWADIAFYRRGMNGELDLEAEVPDPKP